MSNSVYSWSNLNSFHSAETGEGCYYAYYLQYIKKEKGEGNYFSELGSLVHDLLKRIHNKEIFEWDISDELTTGLLNLKYEPPHDRMKDTYENALVRFFVEEDVVDQFKDYKMLAVEEKAFVDIDGIKVYVLPDLVAEHKEKGIVIGDYKISKPYVGDKLKHNILQLYIYSMYVKQLYDLYPDYLVYIYPREPFGRREYFNQFSQKELDRTKYFIFNTIEKIHKQNEWPPRCELVNPDEDLYANHLCSFRNVCPYKCNKK